MLAPIDSPQVVRDYLVYDLEWAPPQRASKEGTDLSDRLRMVGVYGRGRYRHYTSIASFLDKELTSANRGKWFYAHAGGLADFQFVLHELVRRHRLGRVRINVEASFSGSSAIIVKVRQGKNCWHFIDSYWLLRDKLSNIGKFIGLEKGKAVSTPTDDPDEEGITDEEYERRSKARKHWYATVPFAELMDYNEQDCLILHNAIHEFQNELLELGGQLQMTVASCAMQLFRRSYLKQEIRPDPYVNTCATEAYTASRVEKFCDEVQDAYYYDINSSFPYAMTFPCPGNFKESSRHMPKGEDAIYLADCRVTVPEADITPLPFRHKSRIFFPSGSWRSWFTNIDLELLQEEGGRIERCYEVLHFEPFHDLRSYAQDIYDRRKKEKDPFKKLVKKYLLNSLYGKFAEKEHKNGLVINPKVTPITQADMDAQGLTVNLFPGAWIKEYDVAIAHRHVPIAAHITAIARRTLYRFLALSRDRHYCDTDGFSTREPWETSNELGGLKLEKLIADARFDAPKFYLMKGSVLQKDGSWKNETMAKAKGMSRMTPTRYMKLVEHEAIECERMVRIKENFTSGHTAPTEKTYVKTASFKSPHADDFDSHKHTLPKRMPYPDGESRPWSVNEIHAYLGA